ncbi:MAG: alginate export family protein [Candidatus Nitronauta litoralis]|uniref:Alginate export family protein n=1 Tax=Candidatus Nitronauta litoralis TaxID=2705533 RepID=A0A7T0G0L9_9BACT|nr:MAG: alginate export family protein [Candidatus Nitronauta litoralis]
MALFFVLFFIPTAFPAFAQNSSPWKIEDALHLPEWFSVSGEHRARYETLSEQFRLGSNGSDQILSFRTLAQARIKFNDEFQLKLELQDARAELADSGSRINNSIVNAAELLEANLVWKTGDLFLEGSESILRAGRFTLDLGKRRFVARNRFRNVIQGYSGLDWLWTAQQGVKVRTLLTLPVNRQPTVPTQLLNNDTEFDEESLHQIFWGIFISAPDLPAGHAGEISFFALHEDDANKFQTRNREIYTPGFRFYRPEKAGNLDYELETMLQFGSVRATPALQDTRDLDHFAHFHHAEVGYTVKSCWRWRFFLEYDYASGDADPADGKSGRFERLFGPNITDFGPTSIHTAFVRANISSPGARLQVQPHKKVSGYISYRAFWLASNKDGWQGASGLRDVTGNSEHFLGHQLFLRGKWKAHPNLKLEGGVVYRIDGDFQQGAPGAPGQGNSLYSYISTTLSF